MASEAVALLALVCVCVLIICGLSWCVCVHKVWSRSRILTGIGIIAEAYVYFSNPICIQTAVIYIYMPIYLIKCSSSIIL